MVVLTDFCLYFWRICFKESLSAFFEKKRVSFTIALLPWQNGCGALPL